MINFTDDLRPPVLVLTQQEHEFLDKYGHWLDRLESGAILPSTDRQSQFLAVIRGEAAPQHANEHLWLRVGAAREAIRLRDQLESERTQLINRLASQGALVEKLYDEIDSQKKEVAWQKQLITKLQRAIEKYEPLAPEPVPSKGGTYAPCKQCGGDGGAGGRCPSCGGNGFEP